MVLDVSWVCQAVKPHTHTLFGGYLGTASAALEGLGPPRSPRGGRHRANWPGRGSSSSAAEAVGLALQPLVAPSPFELLDCAGRALVVMAVKMLAGRTAERGLRQREEACDDRS